MKKHVKGLTTQKIELLNEKLKVTGKIPEWLSGNLYLNGPGLFEVGEEKFKHWFDGQGMLHKFSVNKNGVEYTNRFTESLGYKKAVETGRICYNEFGTFVKLPFFRLLKSLLTKPEFSYNCNINVIDMDDHVAALTEIPEGLEINSEDLSTMGVLSYENQVPGQISTAHVLYDHKTRAMYNINVSFGMTSCYYVYRVPYGTRKHEQIATVSVKEPSYMHSFSLTDRYFIITENPFRIKPYKLIFGGKPYIKNYTWQPEMGARFTLVEKETGKVTGPFETDPFFVFHHANAFDADDEVVVDIPVYADSSIIDAFFLETLRESEFWKIPKAEVRRYRIKPADKSVTWESLGDTFVEFPRINCEEQDTRNYQFIYGNSLRKDRPGEFFNQLAKLDLHNKTAKTWYIDDCFSVEPVFVRSPDAQQEDDGVVLSVILDGNRETSFLLILDARSFEELARAEVPQHVPFSFHGDWFPDK